MHLRTRLNHPVKLEKQAASTLADRNEAAQCGRNLATFLSRAFNEELGDAFRRLSEYCAWLVLNDTSFTWEDHVRVLEDALQRIDDNVVSSEVAVAQWAWEAGTTLSNTNSAAAVQQLRDVVESAAEQEVVILTRPQEGLDPFDEHGVLAKRYAANQFRLASAVNRLGMSDLKRADEAAAAPVAGPGRTTTGKGVTGPPGARAKGIQAETTGEMSAYTLGQRRCARRRAKRRDKASRPTAGGGTAARSGDAAAPSAPSTATRGSGGAAAGSGGAAARSGGSAAPSAPATATRGSVGAAAASGGAAARSGGAAAPSAPSTATSGSAGAAAASGGAAAPRAPSTATPSAPATATRGSVGAAAGSGGAAARSGGAAAPSAPSTATHGSGGAAARSGGAAAPSALSTATRGSVGAAAGSGGEGIIQQARL